MIGLSQNRAGKKGTGYGNEMDFRLSTVRRQDLNEINTFFAQINEFVRVTLKFKETITQAHLAQIR